MLKVEFEDLRNFFLLPGHPGSTLRNFFEKFFEKKIPTKKFLNGPIRKVIMLKVKFEDLRIFFLLPGHPSFHRKRPKCSSKITIWKTVMKIQ